MIDLKVDHKRLLDTMENGILLIDENNVIAFANQKIANISGFSKEELIGKNKSFLIKNDNDKIFLIPKNNNHIDVEIGINDLFNDNGNQIGKIINIQNILELEKDFINHQNETLEQLNEFMIQQLEINNYHQLTKLVASQLTKFLNAVVTIYNEYDEREKLLIVKELHGNNKLFKMANNLLGNKINNIKMPISDEIYQQILNEKVKVTKSIHENSLGVVSKPVSDIINKSFSLKSFIALAYTVDEKVYATTTVALKEDIENYMIELLRTYAYFTAVSLKRIKTNEALKNSEEKFSSFFKNMIAGGAIHQMIYDENNNPVDYKFLDSNKKFEQLTGLKKAKIVGKTVKEILPNTEDYWINIYGEVAQTGQAKNFQNYSKEIDKIFDVSAFPLKKHQFATVFVDITESKKAQQKIEYLSFHDNLTGLKNRHYFELFSKNLDKPENYPLSIIVIDLNGLKLLNDTYGYKTGDRMLACTAEILKNSCKNNENIIRWGGDEFIVLLPKTNKNQTQKICNTIKKDSKEKCYNCKKEIKNFSISLALGFATKENANIELDTIIVEAENQMNRAKLTESRSARNSIIHAFLQTLRAKNFEESHITRMLKMGEKFGNEIGLNSEDLSTLNVIINLHDIGKININEKILTKKEPLSSEEWLEVKKHPEIGYRIAKETEDFAYIAHHILSHHERWDGQGYPRGLKGHEIPHFARIITILDAWEVMSGGRPYKEKMTNEDIITEFEKCSGTQFDPSLTAAFVDVLKKPKVLKK